MLTATAVLLGALPVRPETVMVLVMPVALLSGIATSVPLVYVCVVPPPPPAV